MPGPIMWRTIGTKKMNSQVCLNNKELQSVAELHSSVLGSHIKGFVPLPLCRRWKRQDFPLLHNIWAKVSWNQSRWRSGQILARPGIILCSSDTRSTTWSSRWRSWCKRSSCWTQWNQQVFSSATAKTGKNKKTIEMHSQCLTHWCFSGILWVWWSELLHHMVSCWPGHAAAPYWNTGSAGACCLTCLTCLLLKTAASSSIMH